MPKAEKKEVPQPQTVVLNQLLLHTATQIMAGQGTSPDVSIDKAKALIFAVLEGMPLFEAQFMEWVKK